MRIIFKDKTNINSENDPPALGRKTGFRRQKAWDFSKERHFKKRRVVTLNSVIMPAEKCVCYLMV